LGSGADDPKMSSDELTAKTQFVIEGLKKLYKEKLMPL
jgi:hypothetical protein